MNEINARLIQVLIGFGYFALAIAVCYGLMKFLGHKILATAGTIFLIGFPAIGILGGAIEWIITGVAEASKSVTFNMADKCFGIAIGLYILAFFAYIFFSEEEKQRRKLDKWDRKRATEPLQGME
jgi:predicted permease